MTAAPQRGWRASSTAWRRTSNPECREGSRRCGVRWTKAAQRWCPGWASGHHWARIGCRDEPHRSFVVSEPAAKRGKMSQKVAQKFRWIKTEKTGIMRFLIRDKQTETQWHRKRALSKILLWDFLLNVTVLTDSQGIQWLSKPYNDFMTDYIRKFLTGQRIEPRRVQLTKEVSNTQWLAEQKTKT